MNDAKSRAATGSDSNKICMSRGKEGRGAGKEGQRESEGTDTYQSSSI